MAFRHDTLLSKHHVKDPGEIVRATLTAALVAFKGRPSERGPLSEFFRSSAGGTQRELVGIYKSLLDLRPSSPKHQCNLIVGAMR